MCVCGPGFVLAFLEISQGNVLYFKVESKLKWAGSVVVYFNFIELF